MGQLFQIAGNGSESKIPPTSRSIAEIFASIQKSKIGIQDWSLSDVTVGLFLVYLRQASSVAHENVKGVQITSESTVHVSIMSLRHIYGRFDQIFQFMFCSLYKCV